jgi:hypothetical protein
MQLIPIRAAPSQTLTATLGGQRCRITIYQRVTGLFCDLYVNDARIIGGVICQHTNLIVRDPYLGFIGDLAFLDQQGADDPIWSGLGIRWVLGYIEPDQFLVRL